MESQKNNLSENSEEQRGLLEKFLRLIKPRASESLKESLEELIEEHEEEGEKIDPEEKKMLSNVLAFGDLRVDQVMVPRAFIDAVEENITIEQFRKMVIEKGHTRTPVYRRTLDEVKGFIHVKDLFQYSTGDKPFSIKEVLRPLLFVPPSLQIIDLLAKMRASHVHMALVVDEYGGTKGLVTMEDLMEKIVGEIKDEHDESGNEHEFSQIGEFIFEMNAAMPINRLEKKIGMAILSEEERGDFDTIGGMIFTLIGRIPARGESIIHPSGLVFDIVEADMRKIKKVRVRKGKELQEKILAS